MTPLILDATVTNCLSEISERLVAANAMAKGALVCAEEGNQQAALRIALDLEPLIHEANTLLNAASLMNRLRNKTGEDDPGG